MTLLSWLLEAVLSFFAKRILGAVFPEKSPAQEAVDTETKMAQAVADTPDKAAAIQELEDGTA
jgi:hypothetical protein